MLRPIKAEAVVLEVVWLEAVWFEAACLGNLEAIPECSGLRYRRCREYEVSPLRPVSGGR